MSPPTAGVGRVYADHHAATPLSEAAALRMREAAIDGWANPASVHAHGRASRAILERARSAIASAIGASAADVVLTSGGTEACNLAVLGIAPLEGITRAHVVTTEIEHPAIARPIDALEKRGARITRLAVRAGATPDPREVASAITRETSLVAVSWVSHETGSVIDVETLAAHARSLGVPLVIDATQALGKLPIDVASLGASALALASHKIGGPAGAGALWVDRALALEPRQLGGAQERGRRAGSPDVVASAGFGAACTVVGDRLAAMPRIAALRDRLERTLALHGASINGAAGRRVGSVVNASLPGRRGAVLVAALDLEGVSASSGAACSSGLDAPSPVIAAMHPDEPWRAASALRLSLGPETSEADVEAIERALARVLAR